jgi:GxxExxY protein
MKEVVYKELSYKICGLLFETHNTLGRYKNEQQYGDYFEILLQRNKINYKREHRLKPSFRGEHNNRNICDFNIDGKIIIEFKAKKFLTREDYFQLKRYLSSSGLRLGILVNFRQKYLTPKRILNQENVNL